MKNLLYLTLITIAEATIGVFVKLTGDAIPVFTLNCYQVGFAFFFLLATVPFIKWNFWQMDRDGIKPLFFIGHSDWLGILQAAKASVHTCFRQTRPMSSLTQTTITKDPRSLNAMKAVNSGSLKNTDNFEVRTLLVLKQSSADTRLVGHITSRQSKCPHLLSANQASVFTGLNPNYKGSGASGDAGWALL